MPIRQQVSRILADIIPGTLPDLTSFHAERHSGYKFLALHSAGRLIDAMSVLNQIACNESLLNPFALPTLFPDCIDPLVILNTIEDYYLNAQSIKNLLGSQNIYARPITMMTLN